MTATIYQLRPGRAPEAQPSRSPARKKSRRRRSSWGTVQLLASGRYQARYPSPIDGRRVTAPQTFDDETTARIWLAKERPLTEDPESWTPPKERLKASLAAQTTFGDYSRRWLEQRTGLKPRTRAEYERLLDLLSATFDMRPIHRITRSEVKQWHAAFCVDRPTQQARAYSLLRTIMKEAVSDELIDKNPVEIRGASSVERARTIEVLSPGEVHQLANAMPTRWRALVYVSVFCMLRQGEAMELRRRDLDLDADTPVIRVTRAVSRVSINGATHVLVGKPKSKAGVRDVPIPATVVPILREHLARHVGASADALVFPSGTGQHLSPSTLYGRPPSEGYAGRGFYAARVAAGRPTLNWHALRHTGAVLVAQTGATIAELMALLGHASPEIAMRYQHVAADRPAHNVRKLDDLIQLSQSPVTDERGIVTLDDAGDRITLGRSDRATDQ